MGVVKLFSIDTNVEYMNSKNYDYGRRDKGF